MSEPVKVRVFRYDPEKSDGPHYDEYLVDCEDKTSVLVLLNRVQKEKDPTLGFRGYCCGLNLCRSCLMRINWKKRYACLTLVGPGDEVIVEPARFPDRHVKDLVVKLKDNRS